MKKDELLSAILFKKIELEDGLIVEKLERILYGTSNQKKTLFKDYFSGQTYKNSDLVLSTKTDLSFYWVYPVKKLKKKYKENGIIKLTQKYMDDLEKNAYYYTSPDTTMCTLPKDHFEDKYGVLLDYLFVSEMKIADSTLDSSNIEENIESSIFSFETSRISDIYNEITKTVISQDAAIKKILTAVYKNNRFNDTTMKSNIFVYGPTGVGKTEIFRTISRMFDIPILIEDITQYTPAGYKGSNAENILINLYNMANGDLEVAQRSILVLDEIDKKVGDGDRNFNKEDFLKELLKIIEGGTYNIGVEIHKSIKFDTSKLTVVVCGAFTDLYHKNGYDKRPIGYGKSLEINDKKIELSDFVKYGIPEEFLGRFDTVVGLNPLKKEDYIKILKESNKSPLTVYVESFKNIGIDLYMEDDIIEKIADEAVKIGVGGARTLKLITDKMLSEILYEVFDITDMNVSIGITKDTIENNKVYVIKKNEIGI